MESLWVLEMILMIAIGTLFDANPEGNDDFSGVRLFEYAHRNVPTLSDLRFNGKLGIEIFALFAIYLGNMNRKEEAYLYVSCLMANSGTMADFARRLAPPCAWQFHRSITERLAAATGNPPSIGDEAINIPLPTDSPGFPPVGPMCTNIRIARATGRILAVLYNPEDESESTFIPHVQDIVKSLYQISQEIPSDAVTDVYNLGRDQSLRTTASLHLMLFQLHASPLGRLSRTCAEAARRQLKVVATLRKRNMIAIFGFYDFEASFSAAFIMILAAILDSVCEESMKINPKPGLTQALEEIQHLADHGNTYARERLQEVKRLWKVMAQKIESLQVVNVSPQGPPGEGQTTNGVAQTNGATPSGFGGLHRGELLPGDQSQTSPEDFMPLDTDLWDNFSNLWVPMPEVVEGGSQQEMMMGDIPTDDFYKHCYSMYNNPDWDLTGEDVGDFAELGRHIQDS
uniref:Transcription factor domain-containing protein n=1 Tax=Fusarium oxysporum (strain Fo5176) TaxID=660025 RepID=A0A0D2XQ09_FUSOF